MQIVTEKTVVYQQKPRQYLTDYSPKDKSWDVRRAEADAVEAIFRNSSYPKLQRYGQRMGECASFLRFGREWDTETGERLLKLRDARFCRVRLCPVCQWRRSLMLRSRFYRAMPRLQKEFPTARWIFFTLTVKNCEVTDLSETLDLMLKAWQKLVQRKEFRPVLGWLRTTEVTRGKDGTAHPHFHVMMMVPPSWFSHHYVKHERWVQIWKESLQVDYTPVVDIRAIRETVDEADDRIRGAILETLKYSVKPSDMTADPEWLEELAHQTHKRRFFVSGGVLSDALREEEESDEELALADGEADQSDDGWRMAFGWDPGSRRYRRDPHFDSPAGEITGIRRGGSSPPSRMGQGLGG